MSDPIQTKAEYRSKVDKWLDEHTPPGWTRQLVSLPGHAGCRSCGLGSAGRPDLKFMVGLVYLPREESKVLLYAYTTLCRPCFESEDAKAALVAKVFGQVH